MRSVNKVKASSKVDDDLGSGSFLITLDDLDSKGATPVAEEHHRTPDLFDDLLGVADPSDLARPNHLLGAPTTVASPRSRPTDLQGRAGWFVDPTNPGTLRYWDGSRWTGDVVQSATAPLPPPPTATPIAPAPERREPAEPETGSADAHPGPGGGFHIVRGSHYVLGAVPARPLQADVDEALEEGVSLVSGEMPLEYDRVTIECVDGSTAEGTILEQRVVRDCHLFVALVGAEVTRIVATRLHGAQGIFLDLSHGYEQS